MSDTEISWGDLCELDDTFYNGWRLMERKQTGTWRWGYNERCIVQRESDNKFFAVDLQITSGDNGPGYSWEDKITIGNEVRPVERTVTTWEKVT